MENTFDNDKFISLIEARSCLWDTAESDYSNKKKKQQCWMEVAKEMYEKFDKLPPSKQIEYGKKLQRRWKNLRNCFARELFKRKHKQPGSAATWKTYIFFDQLSFLLRCVTNKETMASMNSTPDQVCDNIKSESNLPEKEPQPKRQCTTIEKNKDASAEVLEVIKSSLYNREANERPLKDDEERHFLLSLLGDLKKVSEERKFDVKFDIMQVIRKALVPQPAPIVYNNYAAPQNFPPTSTLHCPLLRPTTSQFCQCPINQRQNDSVSYHAHKIDKNVSSPRPATQSHLQDLSPSEQSPYLLSPRSGVSSCNSDDSQVLDPLILET